MAQEFKETAHLKTDKKKFDEGYNRIFGKKEKPVEEVKPKKKGEPERRIFDKAMCTILPYDPEHELKEHQVIQVQDKGGVWHDE